MPVSPSTITGIHTLSAIHPAMVNALAHRPGADIGKPGVGAHTPPVPTNRASTAGLSDDPRMRRVRRMQDHQHLVAAVDQLLQSGARGSLIGSVLMFGQMMTTWGMLVEQQFPR